MAVERRKLSYDPFDGLREDYFYDHADDTIRIASTENVGPLLDAVQEARNARGEGVGAWKGDFVPVAHLSPTMVMELMRIGIMSRGYKILDAAAFQVWLDEHNKLKATRGKF
jgi:hypothetical protein